MQPQGISVQSSSPSSREGCDAGKDAHGIGTKNKSRSDSLVALLFGIGENNTRYIEMDCVNDLDILKNPT